MDLGLVALMCGDGGNDCGALRAAHAGVALSEAEASVVSPFTSRTKSIHSVVDLLREGRCALATSFASYKFLVTYGQLFSVLKLVCFWYGVIMSMMCYVFIDGLTVLLLSYAITLSQPLARLRRERPTASLLGPEMISSVVGMQATNLVFLAGALGLMHDDPAYVKWPAQLAEAGSWWTLGDAWEATVVFVVVVSQFMTSALLFTLGSKYRQPVWRNGVLCGLWALFFGFVSFLLLAPPDTLTETFHIASTQYNRNGTNSVVWQAWQAEGHPPSGAMSESLRGKLWAMILACLAVNLVWEKVVVQGPVNDALTAKYVPEPVQLTL